VYALSWAADRIHPRCVRCVVRGAWCVAGVAGFALTAPTGDEEAAGYEMSWTQRRGGTAVVFIYTRIE